MTMQNNMQNKDVRNEILWYDPFLGHIPKTVLEIKGIEKSRIHSFDAKDLFLKYVQEHHDRCGLAVMDYGRESPKGIELIERVRSLYPIPRPLIVTCAVGAIDGVNLKEIVMDAGATDFFFKAARVQFINQIVDRYSLKMFNIP